MGLDMYLNSLPKLEDKTLRQMLSLDNKLYRNKELQEQYKDLLTDRYAIINGATFSTELIYWRKANQIHAWFVRHIQRGVDNCGSYTVTKKKLEKLLATCYEVDTIFKESKLTTGKVVNGQTLQHGRWINIYEEGDVYVGLDTESINKLLPPQSGFFFGNAEINQWYYHDIKQTIEKLEDVIKNTNFDTHYVYYNSSW